MMLGVLNKDEQTQPLAQWNQTNAEFPLDKCVHQLFEEQVERTPDAVAVVFEKSHLTYRELNTRANQLAHHLISLGVKPDIRVGICVEYSYEMVIGLLGILKAGGTYVPLDPNYPQKRLTFMVKEAHIPVLLMQEKWLERFPQDEASIVCLDRDWEVIAQQSKAKPLTHIQPDNLIYVIYTSGSTGKPKGAGVYHHGFTNLLYWFTTAFQLTANDSVLVITSLSFDLTQKNIFAPLIIGGQLHLSSAAYDPQNIAQLIDDKKMTWLNCTPSMFYPLIDSNNRSTFIKLASLRYLFLGGEAIVLPRLESWLNSATCQAELVNTYGPTECTDVCAAYLVNKSDPQSTVPIGKPIFNTQLFIVDDDLKPLPIGTPGELYIGGEGVGAGYINDVQMTDDRFIPNPFDDDPQSRLYQTRDLACYLPNGNIEYRGRIDNQVKIRGLRIELGEIEAKLHQYYDISDAVVIARKDDLGDKRIVAYIVVSQLPPQRVLLRSDGQIKCVLGDDKTDSSTEVTTFDISYGGVGLSGISSLDFCPDKRYHVCLTMPDSSDKLCVEGDIAWRSGDRLGIQFDPTPEEKILLHKQINAFFEKRGLLKVLQNTFIEHLRHFMQESLPEYMIPSHFVILDALPLTSNGKLDRKALPAPNVNRSDLYTDIEEKLVQIWAEVLGLERVGLHDNFLHLGGHSLLATQIVSHINEELSLELPLYCLFEAPTVAQLAVQVEDALKSSRPQIQVIEQADRHTNLLLSFGQEQLWLFGQFVPNIPVYNEPATIRLGGPIDVRVLEQSLNEIGRRHEILRTTFTTINGEPVQVISQFVPFTLPVVDLRDFPENERETECLRLATEEAVQPFDLEKGPLFRATLICLSDKDYRLCQTAHHIISDGVSLYNVLFPELATLYKAFSAGQASPLPQPVFQYADYASWQRQRLQGEVLEKQLTYWKQQLADLHTLQLPTDHPRPAVQSYRGARYCLALPKALTESLKVLSQQEGVTLFMTLLAAFKTLLHRYSGQDDIPVGTVTSGRHHAELENIFGYFLNTVVLRTDLSDNPSAKQLLQKVREVTLKAYANEDVPFELLVKALHPERQISANPLFQVAFVLEPQVPKIDLGWTLSQLDIHPGTAKFDLTMELDDRPEGIIGRIEYNTDLFDEATIIRMVGHYQTLLEGIVADPEQSISQLPLLTTTEQQQFLAWNKSPLELCVHALFEAQVARNPNAVAVVFEDQQLTYQELNHRANQLAHYLIKLGVKSETLIGVCVERSVEMIVGILGILKAGGAYVPLDPAYPQERLDFMLKDAQIQILLTQKHLRTSGLVRKLTLVICLDSEWEDIANESDKNPLSKTTPDNLAYVIYTSGSTGVPKGVCCHHLGVINLLADFDKRKPLLMGNNCSLWTSLNFDVSVYEIFSALLAAGTLHIVPNNVRSDSTAFFNWLDYQQIQSAYIPPFMLPAFFDWLKQTSVRQLSLQRLLVGVEPIQEKLLISLSENVPGLQIINGYGPTEATICATLYSVQHSCVDDRNTSIGRPVENTQIYILNANMQRVPVGISGELYIGGIGLARGYLNRPELTVERFISNPFSDEPNSRLYKTGDLARYLPDANIEFIGRIDNQVKIRGYRIELGEIEVVLTQHPQIREIVVMAREDIPGDKRLIAYIVAKQQVPSTSELRQFLVDKLPDYMIPSAFVSLETLPLTPNGKVDRQALPKPQEIEREAEAAYVAPQTELEQTIATVWQAVLHQENVGIQESFFELGGHSLLVVQMQEKLVKALNLPIPVTVLFQYSTIQALAQYLSQSNSQPTTTPKRRSDRAAKKQAAMNRRKEYHKTRRPDLA